MVWNVLVMMMFRWKMPYQNKSRRMISYKAPHNFSKIPRPTSLWLLLYWDLINMKSVILLFHHSKTQKNVWHISDQHVLFLPAVSFESTKKLTLNCFSLLLQNLRFEVCTWIIFIWYQYQSHLYVAFFLLVIYYVYVPSFLFFN